MEKEIEKLMGCLSPSEAETFAASFEAFGECDVSADAQNRILSSVMRKARFDMNEHMTAKRKRKNKSRIYVIAAAAALALSAVGVSAYAAGYRLEDGEIVRRFYGEHAENWLESNALNEQQTAENGHYDVTMYSFLSDGNYCQAIWCIEALDDAAKARFGGPFENYDVRAFYADTGEEINMGGSEGGADAALNDQSHHYFYYKILLADVDLSREIELRIESYALMADRESQDELGDGLRFVVDASPNVETKTIANENGSELLLSPLGISAICRDDERRPYELLEKKQDDTDITCLLIRSDGSSEPLITGIGTVEANDGSELVMQIPFYDISDISDVVSVTISGDKTGDETYYAVN